jgi:subtilisin family serine protease
MKTAAKSILALALTINLTIGSAFAAGSAPLAFNAELLISRYASWGIDPDKHLASINLKESWTKFKKNKEIIVAVVDTGIQGDHAFLKDNIYVVGGKNSINNYGVDFSGAKVTNTPSDAHGHGTHVAGIVKSIYPDVKILALKYYNPKASGQANLDATIKALQYAVDNNVDVINYSGGGPEASVEELRVLKAAEKKGILVIAAAGNERSNIDDKRHAYYPASYGLSNIITVGAHDDSLNIIPSSNYGKNSVDIAAPGHRIRSAIPNNGAAYMTGTSQATAFVTGVAAMIKSKHPNMKYDQVKNIILSSSLKVKNFEGKILGAGKLDAARAMELADAVNEKLSAPTTRSVANK